VPVLTFLPDVLEEHLEEIDFLHGQWREAITSPEYVLDKVADLERRILAHVSGVEAVGEGGLTLLEEWLASDTPGEVFAAARGLLELGAPGVERVLAAVGGAGDGGADERLAALAEALAVAPQGEAVRAVLEEAVRSAEAPRATLLARAMELQGGVELTRSRLEAFLGDEDEDAQVRAWWLVGATGMVPEARIFAQAVRDGPVPVRQAALDAGAWCRIPGVLPALRQIAAEPEGAAAPLLELYGTLATAEDREAVEAIVNDADRGEGRLTLAAAYGHPDLMDAVLGAMESADPGTAHAAGVAFEGMTGRAVTTRRVDGPPATEVHPDDANAPPEERAAAEPADVFDLPDPGEARAVWEAMAPGLQGAARIVRGMDANGELDAVSFAAFDMRSRRQAYLRSRFRDGWQGSPAALERFPQGTG
jgi:uncharacterized protein (TIGR02270 family)